jgi:DNA end-binding protein Ku
MPRGRGPRSLWTGSISFGLVNVPVKVYTAVHEHKLRFHLVHEADDGPIGYEKICKVENKPVPDDEIVKAFEVAKGKLVHLDDEDFEAAQVEAGARALELEDFVPYEQIDPTFFAHTYLVGPQEGAEHAYALLVKAMEDSGLAGIGRFVMRNRQYLGCLRVRDKALTLEQLHFADEVDPPEGIVPSKLPTVSGRELELATGLIESLAGDWKPSKYEDTYTDALMSVIKRKQKGEDVHAAPEVEQQEGPPDLMEALHASMEAVKKSRGAARGRAGSRRGKSSARAGGSSRKPRRASSSRSRR